MTKETMKEIEFLKNHKQELESFFGVSMPELDLNSPDLLNNLIKYQTVFDIYDSVSAFKEANGRGEHGLTDAINNGTATYLEGKIVFFNDVNYDRENDDAYEL